MSESNSDPQLRRTLGPVLLCLYGLGNILGAGIYVLVGEVAGQAGLLTPIAFVVAGIVAALSAFSYGELSARYPVSAGEAVWVQRAFDIKALSVVTGVLIASAGLTSAAALARGFAGYLQVLWPIPDALAISVLVIGLGALSAWGVNESVRAAALLTLIEAAGLVLVVVVAGNALEFNVDRAADLSFSGDVTQAITMGAFVAFFAFIGFEDMVNIAEEVRNPQRNMPIAIIAAVSIATLLYVLVATVSVMTVEPAQLASSRAPLALVYERAGGAVPGILAVIGMIAVVNGVLVQVIMAARVAYGMSREGWLPKILGHIQSRTRTPVVATALATAVVLALALSVNLSGLARLTSALVLLVFAVVNVALLIMKKRDPAPPGIRPVAIWLPVLGAISATGLLLLSALMPN
jgi:APA family basic amino acid/polyamine antiporter